MRFLPGESGPKTRRYSGCCLRFMSCAAICFGHSLKAGEPVQIVGHKSH